MKDCKLIFERIDSMRRYRKISIEEFTTQMGYKTKCVYYQTWKEAPENIKLKQIIKAAEVLNCTTDYLLGLSNEIKSA